MHHLPVKRKRARFCGDSSRVITKFFSAGQAWRVRGLIDRVLNMSPAAAGTCLQAALHDFAGRHRNLETTLLEHFNRIAHLIDGAQSLPRERRLLLGAYFTSEYSVEAAALFNPSIVAHPDQDGLPPGSLRFILSFRATGEGHVSSITFRSGVLDHQGTMTLDSLSPYGETPLPRLQPPG